MTDCTKLIERLSNYERDDPADVVWEAADAIEALQEENALLEGTLESRGRNIAALQAENERLERSAKHFHDLFHFTATERDQLQAKLDAMGKGEPVSGNVEILLEAAEVLDKVRSQCDDAWERFGLRDYLPDELHGTALIVRDAAPKALAPDVDWLSNVIRQVDGNNKLGASALAENIVEAISAHGIGGTP